MASRHGTLESRLARGRPSARNSARMARARRGALSKFYVVGRQPVEDAFDGPMWPVRVPGVPRGAKNEGSACYTTCKNNRALVCAPRLLLGGRDHLPVAGVVHVGEGPMSGHLVAIVLRNEAWFPCDDYNIYNEEAQQRVLDAEAAEQLARSREPAGGWGRPADLRLQQAHFGMREDADADPV
ncbi:hypothetical protein KFE25_009866 [Diacronema lutheri]|uniref:Uncharacterized protein n=1 Tax=Diacronema lutheri TaxID=2081491 RepID=A0A8J6CEE9_DIALT|nr:hypothetical protein KFE25_009866 [Diacronema lutheri]